MQNASVVVGIDGSEHSRRALEWAVGEARLRGAVLRLVHAIPFGLTRSGDPDPHLAVAARRLTQLAMLAQRPDGAPLTVATDLVDGLPVKKLVEESRRCELLVMGSRGNGGFTNLLLGSTAVEVTARAACPVAVVPSSTDLQGRSGAVMVGVDASAASEPVLEFAFSRASQRQTRLIAMHVWNANDAVGRSSPPDAGIESAALLASLVAPWQQRFPTVIVERRSVPGQVVTELAAASGAEGEIIVVGGGRRSVVAGAFLGSVSQDLLRQATVPVVIAR